MLRTTHLTPPNATAIVGLDVGKENLDAFLSGPHLRLRIANAPEGIEKLKSHLDKLGLADVMVVMEASGGYERLAHRLLSETGIKVAIVNPKRVRDFAKSMGQRAKTDRIDAKMIALYAQTLKVNPTPVKGLDHQELADLLSYRNHIVSRETALKEQIRMIETPSVREDMQADCAALKAKAKQLEKTIGRCLANGPPEISDLATILLSFKGIGTIAAATLIAYVPELGQLNGKQIAALTGLAPFNHDSGKFEGKRFVDGGREKVRSILYTAAMVAVQHNPALKTFFSRLKERGKKPIVALIASARKIVVILNAMVKKREVWSPDHTGFHYNKDFIAKPV